MEKETEKPAQTPPPALPIAESKLTERIFKILEAAREAWREQDKSVPKKTIPQHIIFYSGLVIAVALFFTGLFSLLKLEPIAIGAAAVFVLAFGIWFVVGLYDFITRDYRALSRGKVAFEGSVEFENTTSALGTNILEELKDTDATPATQAVQRVLRARKRALEVSGRIFGLFSLSSSTGVLAQLTAGLTFVGLVVGLVKGEDSQDAKIAGFLQFDVSFLLNLSPWLALPVGAILGIVIALIGISEGNRWVEREIVALEDVVETLKLPRKEN